MLGIGNHLNAIVEHIEKRLFISLFIGRPLKDEEGNEVFSMLEHPF